MNDPKKYLKRSGSETLDPDMFMNYQRNSTAGASCSNLSPSSKKSFFSRSLKGIANFFTPSTMQEAPTQNVCLNEEDEQQNSIEVQQNIVPQPVQNLQVQQTVQQPIENVQQPAETEAHQEQPVKTPEQQVKPEEALQQPAQKTQSEKEDKTVKEEKVEYKCSTSCTHLNLYKYREELFMLAFRAAERGCRGQLAPGPQPQGAPNLRINLNLSKISSISERM